MALNGNFTSFKSIIEKVYRESGYQTVNWDDALEYIIEALQFIGDNGCFKTVTTDSLNGNPLPVAVSGYRANLPSDFIRIVSASKIELDENNNILGFKPMKQVSKFNQYYSTVTNPVINDPYYEHIELNQDGTFDPVIVNVLNQTNLTDQIYAYRIQNSVIETNFETGYIELTYKAVVVDQNGFPMIPDHVKVQKAVMYSIMERLDYKKWRAGEIPDKVYAHTEKQRDWYMASAKSEADIPSVDRMEKWKNAQLGINPENNNRLIKKVNQENITLI